MDVNTVEQETNLDKISPSEAAMESTSEPVTKKPKITDKHESMVMESETKSEVSNFENKPGPSKKEDSDEEVMNDDNYIPTPGFKYPLEQDASDMLEELEFGDRLLTVTERYFTPYYEINEVKPGEDVCVRIHTNRICMISLAPGHVIFQENKTIKSCNYKVSEKLDRTANKVSGKAKHGAQPLQSNSNLCCLTCTDGSTYMVKCCMIGKLVEVNTNLIENPELLKLEPHLGGYIAIVLPNLKHLDKLKAKLLDQAAYEEAIKKRKEKKEQELLAKNDESSNTISEESTVEVSNNVQQKNIDIEINKSKVKEVSRSEAVETVVQEKQNIQSNSSNNLEVKEVDMDVDS